MLGVLFGHGFSLVTGSLWSRVLERGLRIGVFLARGKIGPCFPWESSFSM
jgi:hypothetical protein